MLLSQMIRNVAITGRKDSIDEWFAGRQSGRWARVGVPTSTRPSQAAPTPSHRPPTEILRDLTELHERGVVSDAEFEELRARLGV
jgi:hypothetical protein